MGLILLFSLFKGLFLCCLGIFGIGFLIAIHELGHFLFCKLFNIATPSFSIGFGPKLLRRKIGETEFSLSILPIGGYVEIAGFYEPGQGDQKEATRSDDRSFVKKPVWQRLLVICGGIIANMLFCYSVLIILFVVGIPATPLLYPDNATTIIKTIEKGGPADKAGLLPGDIIFVTQPTDIPNNDNSPESLSNTLTKHINNPLTLFVVRKRSKALSQNNCLHSTGKSTGTDPITGHAINSDTYEQFPLTVTPTQHPQQKSRGILGVTFAFKPTKARSIPQAIHAGISLTNRFFMSVFSAFSTMITKHSTDGMGGPLMIISATIESAKQGFSLFLLLLAFISVNLAALNLIPLPILDGGQMLIILIEAIIRRQLPEKTKIIVFYICWGLLMLLMVWLSIKDLCFFSNRFFSSHCLP